MAGADRAAQHSAPPSRFRPLRAFVSKNLRAFAPFRAFALRPKILLALRSAGCAPRGKRIRVTCPRSRLPGPGGDGDGSDPARDAAEGARGSGHEGCPGAAPARSGAL